MIGAVYKLENLLEDCTIINLGNGLSEEFGCRVSQNEPILLEDTEVGGVTILPVTCRYVC